MMTIAAEHTEGDLPTTTQNPAAPFPATPVASAADAAAAADDNTADPDPEPTPPLLALCEDLPDVFREELLKRWLDPTDRALLARVARGFKAAVVASGLPLVRPRLKLKDFFGSVERLAWAKANRCPWSMPTCAYVAEGGHLEALRWAREIDCPWDWRTCACAAGGGHLEVLKWARGEQHCPWDGRTCACAALNGHLDVLKWAREHDCPWGATRYYATVSSHHEVLRWADENGCP